jgi:hypothetical protein
MSKKRVERGVTKHFLVTFSLECEGWAKRSSTNCAYPPALSIHQKSRNRKREKKRTGEVFPFLFLGHEKFACTSIAIGVLGSDNGTREDKPSAAATTAARSCNNSSSSNSNSGEAKGSSSAIAHAGSRAAAAEKRQPGRVVTPPQLSV